MSKTRIAELIEAGKIDPCTLEDIEPSDNCAHEWVFTGTAYGGDDPRWFGDGRCFCAKCGADGDA